MKTVILFAVLGLCAVALVAQVQAADESIHSMDMLSPAYYEPAEDNLFRAEVDAFIAACQKEVFHHPLANADGQTPRYQIHNWGQFGAGKPPRRSVQYHPAWDFKMGGGETEVRLYAAHGGRVTTFRDAPKYRHYLAITKPVTDAQGKILGKLVTLYAHIDLDLNEADGLLLDGKLVRKGELLSNHLYAGTMGGPHLHFEVRYYRAKDKGDETFYGAPFPGLDTSHLTEKSAGPWSLGAWDPNVGYGYGNPGHHGLSAEKD